MFYRDPCKEERAAILVFFPPLMWKCEICGRCPCYVVPSSMLPKAEKARSTTTVRSAIVCRGRDPRDGP